MHFLVSEEARSFCRQAWRLFVGSVVLAFVAGFWILLLHTPTGANTTLIAETVSNSAVVSD